MISCHFLRFIKPESEEGEEQNPPNSMPLIDTRDGKVYKTVTIGTQTWMAENLDYEMEGSKRCINSEQVWGLKYGRLYSWEAAMKACPIGWHLPSDKEWQALVDSAGGNRVAAKRLKAKSGWGEFEGKSGNGEDTFGFAAYPSTHSGGYWWSSTESNDSGAYYRVMRRNLVDVFESSYAKVRQLSVRLVQD